MADIGDVLNVLVQECARAVYPPLPDWDVDGETWDSGEKYDRDIDQVLLAAQAQYDAGLYWDAPNKQWDVPGKVSVSGTDVVIYAGWPASDNLAKDLANKKSHITVFPRQDERNTTRYPENEYVTLDPVPTLQLSVRYLAGGATVFDANGALWDAVREYWDVSGAVTVVTVGGRVSVPQNVALRVNGKFYVYPVQKGDTLQSVAAALAGLVGADIPGTAASGQDIAIGPSGRLQAARVGGFGTVAREVRRQERVIQITVWTPTPGLRDVLGAAVDAALAEKRFIRMPDGFGARLIYKNSPVTDMLEKEALYRRDLNYTVEYGTTISKQVAQVIAPFANVNDFTITA